MISDSPRRAVTQYEVVEDLSRKLSEEMRHSELNVNEKVDIILIIHLANRMFMVFIVKQR